MNTKTDINEVLACKNKTRKEILGKLKSQSNQDILKKSEIIKKRLFETREFREAKCVIFFVSMPEEVNTHYMIDESIEMGKQVGVPVLISAAREKGMKDLIISKINDKTKQLEVGPYGIRQPRPDQIAPIPYEAMDLVIVPGIAFDKYGNRLGRGKGYYDRFLEKLPGAACTTGVCFDFQVLKSIPKASHDIPVKMLLTN